MRLTSVLAGTAVVLLLGAGMTGSTRSVPVTPLLHGHARAVPVADAPAARAYGAADTRFGLGLLRRLAHDGGNTVVSPVSVAGALGMAYLGARGRTATSMARCLALPATGTAGLAGLRGRTAGLRGLPDVSVRDTVWLDPSLPISPDYLDRVATAYDAGVRQAPTLSDPAGAAEAINDTVDAQTHHRIPSVVTPGQLDGVGWVLTDTVHLDARWATPFDAHATEPGPFRGPHGTTTAKYLRRTGTLRTAARDGWTAVSLPYAGGRTELLALLPDDGVAATPAPGTLDGLVDALAPATVSIALPTVSLAYSAELSGPLRAMGMGAAFGSGADFTGISPDAGPIAFVNHRATLDVAEKGTEAAAATAVGIEATSARVAPNEIRFDHPYLMLIRDTRTGEPLFLARVNDPASGA